MKFQRRAIVSLTLLVSISNLFAVETAAREYGEAPNSDASRGELIAAVQSRDVEAVRSILNNAPDLASSEAAPGVPILLLVVFSKDEQGFIQPENNELVSLFLPLIREFGIFEACVLGNLVRVKELLEQNPALVDSTAPSGWTLMHFAAFSGNVELVKYLFEKGAGVNARAWKSSYIVPLLSAMLVKRYEVSKLLLEIGADPLVRERGGFSAMHEAANLGDTVMIRLLFDYGAELNSRRDNGERPIDLAMKHNYTSSVSLLKELGAEE